MPMCDVRSCSPQLGAALPPSLTKLTLGLSGDEVVAGIVGSWAGGSLPALRELQVEGCEIGDAGIAALAEASARGAMPELRTLWLNSNHIGDDGVQRLGGTKGAFAALEGLYLQENKIGSAGMYALAGAIAAAGGAERESNSRPLSHRLCKRHPSRRLLQGHLLPSMRAQ